VSSPTTTEDSIFDETQRSDRSPATDTEDSFRFLNRVDGPFWQRIRVELETWFGDYPFAARADLRERFRSRKPDQHFPAWWELYQHRLWRRLGFDVAVHPTLPNGARPDLLVTGESGSFYVEALTIMSSLATAESGGALKAEIQEAINTIDAPDFWMSIRYVQAGHSAPPKLAFKKQIEGWLRKLDADQLLEMEPTDWPRTTVRVGEWVVSLKAFPISPEHRGKPKDGLIGIGPAIAGYVNEGASLGKAIEQRRKRAQRSAAECPVVLAALFVNGMFDDSGITEALFGSEVVQLDQVRPPGGLWVTPDGPRNRRISGLLVGRGIMPHNCGELGPRLWHHPAPDHPLDVDLPLAAARIIDGELRFEHARRRAHDVFGLPAEWPGPGSPFDR
jgi:hypothetical protein